MDKKVMIIIAVAVVVVIAGIYFFSGDSENADVSDEFNNAQKSDCGAITDAGLQAVVVANEFKTYAVTHPQEKANLECMAKNINDCFVSSIQLSEKNTNTLSITESSGLNCKMKLVSATPQASGKSSIECTFPKEFLSSYYEVAGQRGFAEETPIAFYLLLGLEMSTSNVFSTEMDVTNQKTGEVQKIPCVLR